MAPAATGVELRFVPPGPSSRGAIEVHGLPAAALERLADADLEGATAREMLSVRTVAAGEDLPAVLGRRSLDGAVLRFAPRLAFRPGLAYRARFDGAALERLAGGAGGGIGELELLFEPAIEPAAATRVEAIYPSAELLPENQLRLYVWFSAPMRRRVLAGIRLIDVASGEPVELPFVEIADGLWDPSGRRLTLFFHPGRVKRGVGPRAALGPPLTEGRRYRLEIDGALRDASGRPLAAPYRKSFTAGPPDRRSPDPAAWRLTPPAAPGEPLRLEFPEPLDHGLLLRLITIRDAAGSRLEGEVAIGLGETVWEFLPAVPWRPGAYRVEVARSLEDLAGNNLERLFEQAPDAAAERPRGEAGEPFELRFDVPAAP